ncbi:transglycosylase SLT domain-containing protein [Thermosipho ferrireducens]|uniref:Transglycosylase SLT domain-containing protein n=1 Tax=Thermosipho ferrireducens TaxID=2571116 RepID=A0ABX7SAG9_9BACT|nr:transglycosylase SLT domain-containing protein [Thermosipho ferrireducens]QTA38747.1 transglycosylase SLT domain-containing protein [Thermosipho ferrireducens]
MRYLTLLLVIVMVTVNFALPGQWFRDMVKEYRSAHGLETDEDMLYKIEEAVLEASKNTGLDPLLIISVIVVESEFRNVIGLYGELGMMQIKPQTAAFVAKKYGIKEPEEGWIRIMWDFKLNIKIGTYYLKYLYEKYGSITKAVENYNGGIYKEIYAKRILEKYSSMLKLASTFETGG